MSGRRFFVAQAAARLMVAPNGANGGSGVIINMSSQMGHVGSERDRTVYVMTKHAIEGLTKAMAVELAPKGVRVVSIAPTFVLTPLTKPFFDNPETRKWVLDRIPLGRGGTVEEVAQAVVFFAFPAASLVTDRVCWSTAAGPRGDETARSDPRSQCVGRVAAVPPGAAQGARAADDAPAVIGLLAPFTRADTELWHRAFRQGLHDLGWVEGGNVRFEYRYADGQVDRLPELVAELINLKVDVIVTAVTPDALAAAKATKTIPIVMAATGDLVATGLIASLAWPGGDIPA